MRTCARSYATPRASPYASSGGLGGLDASVGTEHSSGSRRSGSFSSRGRYGLPETPGTSRAAGLGALRVDDDDADDIPTTSHMNALDDADGAGDTPDAYDDVGRSRRRSGGSSRRRDSSRPRRSARNSGGAAAGAGGGTTRGGGDATPEASPEGAENGGDRDGALVGTGGGRSSGGLYDEADDWYDNGYRQALATRAAEAAGHVDPLDARRRVTLFGFVPGSHSWVLRHFQQFGTVVHQEISHGNWMHIEYETEDQAAVAVGQNGKVVDGVMLGAVFCTAPLALRNGALQSARRRDKVTGHHRLFDRPGAFGELDTDMIFRRRPRRPNWCQQVCFYLCQWRWPAWGGGSGSA